MEKYYPSYWEKSVITKSFDFLILGAGLIGKQIALKLVKKYPKAKIGILDKFPIPYGASTRNAGFVCFGSPSELLDDLSHSKTEDVYNLVEKRYIGAQQLIKDFGSYFLDYQNNGGFETFETKVDFDQVHDKIEELNLFVKSITGKKCTYEVNDINNLGFGYFHKSFFNSLEGQINTGMLNEAIAYELSKSNVLPFYGFDATQISFSGKSCLVSDSKGLEFETKQLIVANNAFAKLLFHDIDIHPARGQVLITKPIDNLKFKGTFHSDKGFIYFRNIDNRLLIGGARNYFLQQENTFEMTNTENVIYHLNDYITKYILPNNSYEIDMQWSGIMAMGKDKLPIVKRENDSLILCVRMGGMGVALGPVLSDEVVSMC